MVRENGRCDDILSDSAPAGLPASQQLDPGRHGALPLTAEKLTKKHVVPRFRGLLRAPILWHNTVTNWGLVGAHRQRSGLHRTHERKPASRNLFFYNWTRISSDWKVRWRDTTLASLARQPHGPAPLDNDALNQMRGCVGRNRTRAVFEFHRELTIRR
jgi:hypothetical protein